MPEPPQFNLRKKYLYRGLQVIVKLANIELTSERPSYEGGSWHVEGQLVSFHTPMAQMDSSTYLTS